MRRLAPLLVLLLIMVAACSSTPAVDEAQTVTTAPTPDGLPESLAFTADTVDGTTFDGADYAGQDLMLWFWAPW